ncbi:MAG: hypothetical protein H7Y59_06025 [Anaerolineales bacterium]|nr:hypothetical protein [Anaerolineales bacterium]
MFGELPKLLDRKFALGYFLPGATFITATIFLFSKLNLYADIINQIQKDLLVGTTTIGLLSWLCGIFLLGTNRSIIRLAEGYGKYNPLKLLLRVEKRRYERAKKEIVILDEIYKETLKKQGVFPATLRLKRNHLMEEIVVGFPDKPELILPTSFGNTIRAFEVYPRVIYGIEAIQGWNRLVAIIPKDFLELIDDAKSQLDFWINLGFLSIVFLAEYVGLIIVTGQKETLWLPAITITVIMIANSRAKSSAIQWGELIKSSFDVFLPKLLKELAIDETSADQREIWTKFSQRIIYRIPLTNPETKTPIRDHKKNKKITKKQ